MITPQQQAALYYARRRRLANSVLQGLAPWSENLEVTAGQYVSAENGTAAYLSLNSGTTGSISPTGLLASDAESGGVKWQKVNAMSLLQFLYTGVPTP
jgi:hypothetical protein